MDRREHREFNWSRGIRQGRHRVALRHHVQAETDRDSESLSLRGSSAAAASQAVRPVHAASCATVRRAPVAVPDAAHRHRAGTRSVPPDAGQPVRHHRQGRERRAHLAQPAATPAWYTVCSPASRWMSPSVSRRSGPSTGSSRSTGPNAAAPPGLGGELHDLQHRVRQHARPPPGRRRNTPGRRGLRRQHPGQRNSDSATITVGCDQVSSAAVISHQCRGTLQSPHCNAVIARTSMSAGSGIVHSGASGSGRVSMRISACAPAKSPTPAGRGPATPRSPPAAPAGPTPRRPAR